ncbi:unnamed protein product [Camellia sinensis]
MSTPDFDNNNNNNNNNNNSCNDEVDVGGGGVPNGIVVAEILERSISPLFASLPEKDQLELIEEASNEVVDHHQIQPGTTTTGGGVFTVIEKLPDENEKDFRLRRIVELLSNLPLNSRKMLWDKAHSRLDQLFPGSVETQLCSFKMKTIDLRQPGDSGGDNGDGRGRGFGGGGGGATQGGEGDTEKRRLLCFSCFE